MLAIIVGIGWLIYNQTEIQKSINAVFQNADSLMSEASTKPSTGTAGQQ